MRRVTGRRDDLEELYRLRFTAFVRCVAAIVGDGELALDVVQDAFAKALRKRLTFRGDGDLEAWVWSIALNLARDRLRTRMREVRPISASADTDGEPLPDETDHSLRTLVLGLPERQRLTIFLRYYADLSYEQVAEALNVRPGTVAASLNAAHRALRTQMSEVQS